MIGLNRYYLGRGQVRLLTLAAFVIMLTGVNVNAQCPTSVLTSGLHKPTKVILSQKGNLLVAEPGTASANTGRVSIIDPTSGTTRTLLDGLPSALNLVAGEPNPSGPSGLALRGRTLFVTIGSGNATLPGPAPGAEVPNPNVSSPLFSSVLEVHFSANVEMTTTGFTLTPADQLALKNGQTLLFDNGGGNNLTISLLTDFPDYVSAPRPGLPNNVVSSNPFGVVVSDEQLYVVDASLNLVAQVDTDTGATTTLTTFANLPNPLFPMLGPPTIQAVPDSIHLFGEQVLVTLLSGFPFPPGAAQVRVVDPVNGSNQPFITGLTSAIDVLPVKTLGGGEQFLTLEFSTNQLAGARGRLQLFATPAGPPVVLANCLITPTSMAFEQKTGRLFVTEMSAGRIIEVAVAGISIPGRKRGPVK